MLRLLEASKLIILSLVHRKVAWSRLGGIAYIASDGVRVCVRNLQARSADGKWVLGDEFPIDPVTEAHNGNLLLHVSWNEAGSELAVVDCLGRVSIYQVFMALNNITGLRQATYDSSDDSNQIVGLMWLSPGRQVSSLTVVHKPRDPIKDLTTDTME